MKLMSDGDFEATIGTLPKDMQPVFRVMCSEAVNLQKRAQNELGDEVAVLLTIKVKGGAGGSFMLPGESDAFPEITGVMLAARCLAKFSPEIGDRIIALLQDVIAEKSKVNA